MNLRHQETFCIALLLCAISITLGQDFQFANEKEDEVQPMLAEPLDVVRKAPQPIKSIYSKEKAQCSATQSRIILSLVLRSHSWDEVNEKKRQKAVNKLSKFFLIPKENFIIDDVTRSEIHQMTKNAIRHGQIHVNNGKRKLGRIGFLIGCGKTIFPSEKLIANTIAQQMKEKALDDISGLDFGWWSIWAKHAEESHQRQKLHLRRLKRQTNGDDYENDDDEYDYNYEDEDEAEPTETPQHAHRHHHGDGSDTTPSTVSNVPLAGSGEKREPKEDTYEDNYDDEYDDELEEETTTSAVPTGGRPAISIDPAVVPVTTESTTPEPTTTPQPTTIPSTSSTTTITTEASTVTTTTTTTTTVAPTTTASTTTVATTTELDEPTNLHPIIKNRIPKMAIIAGKVFSLPVPLDTFQDNEDGNNLRLDLSDAHGHPLKNNSWIQFNVETREIYGLPLEKDVSKWHYILQATDSGDLSVNETVDISVQQHKSHRSVNHEISLALRLQRKFPRNVDWQIEVIRGIAKVLGDVSLTNIVVREVRNSIQDPNLATFVYTNDTLPKDRCPEEKLDELVAQLTEKALNDALNPDILVKSVQGQQIGQCLKSLIPKVKPTPIIATKNFAPVTRNQVDRVNATVGHLLVYKVPADTFYDPEDGNDLKLKLLTTERNPLDQYHWLQFDSKNHEFFGIPRSHDVGQKEYLLMAEDREGLTATDALVVVVHQAHYKRDYSVLFELTLDTTHEQFSIAQAQRRFIERLAQVFGDANTNYIQIRNIRTIHHTGQVQVTFFNTTLYRQHQRCPDEEIEALRNILLYPDGTIRAKVREILGQEFSLQNVSLIPVGTCQGYDTPIHATNEPEKALPPPIAKDDYLLTFVLPAVIILAMLLIASIIACVLYRRRLTGKMELGTDEERKSFRSKGIPVIFQDELDEKPEIGNKSPVILKDEKPPLLPPSYSSTNNDGENEDLDEYVPPPAVVVGGRESRGKSPVTPSYRRPPPYVSP
ncbi:uncharacterized protein LOC128738209 [Sabethes cyaneus]|uniref:uncharacterized protein LOC128738209 n=1 Tax=Sabethes cyaneus TaxID=53552 RepID=UPI00237E16EA|nr:uncharacterized protein LOC128738209 [Sabethes cyaneus]XP_053689146.1 uncharacterized protein LOC128738209 [Sabethes cyaneus]XP_053689147.1 uncharacterized protein LOC128738209 [Sabethes cyaneus]XP_053689148.1 uncharacterized protein LOC128738209 [Sabethes cyaneus]